MVDSQSSCVYEVKAGAEGIGDVSDSMTRIEDYFKNRIKEIEERLLGGSRSIFDFVDMAVIIGALANATDAQSKCDTDQYIDFVNGEFISTSEAQGNLVATAFYCLMRCGLVHEMSLGAHNIRPPRRQIINGYSISVTHDKSCDGNWYSVNVSANEIVFHAHELLRVIKSCFDKCFNGSSTLWRVIKDKVNSERGIKIITVK